MCIIPTRLPPSIGRDKILNLGKCDVWVDWFTQVKAVDTSGAGDAFLGTLAAQLARGVRTQNNASQTPKTHHPKCP